MKKISFILGTFIVFGFLVSVAPQAVSAATVFSDGFGTGSTDSSFNESPSWTEGGDGAEKRAIGSGNDTASPEGGRFAITFGKDGYICREIDATGYTNVQLSYYWRGDSDAENSDRGIVEFRKGGSCSSESGWTQLQNYDLSVDSTWQTQPLFSNSSLDNDEFFLRFRNLSSQDDEHFRVDGVVVKGDRYGQIVIRKIVDPEKTKHDFDFSTSDNLSPSSFKLGKTSFEKKFENLLPGVYTITEDSDPGFLLTSIVCTDDGQFVVKNLETGTVTINLPTSGEVRCTYTNTEINLIVEKVIVGDDNANPEDFSFTVDKSGQEPPIGHQFDADGVNTITGLANGAYTVLEDSEEGYTTTYTSDRPGANANHCNNIDVDNGNGTHTCTITNTKKGKIIIEKQTLPDGSDVSFEFDTSYDESNFNLSDGETNDSGYLNPGTYSVTEVNIPENWNLSSAVCSDESQIGEINLGAGEVVTCVFTNQYDEPPQQCEEGEQWAYEVESSDQGTRKDGSGVLASRTNPASVLGAPDGNGAAGTGFFSLGVDGTITVKFSHFIENVLGDDLYFYEITNGRTTYPEELAKVEVSQDGSTWYEIGTVSSKPTGVGSLDFDSTGLDWIMFVRVTDVTNFSLHSNDADGYDLDAIKAANGLCEEPEEPLACVPELNLLANSGFENPDVTHQAGWDVFASGTLGLDWIVNWESAFVGAPDVANLELHGGVNGWLPNSGSQYAELDTDWDGPSGIPGPEQSSVSIYQNVPTVLGETYTLSYNFSPRPGANSSQNVLEVYVDGLLKNTHSASGAGQTSWTPYSLDFTGTGGLTKIEFRDGGTPDSIGTFLDDVSLVCVPKQTPCEEVLSSQTIVSDDTTLDGDGFASELTFIHPAWTASIPDATWIWATDPVEAPTNDGDLTKVFTKTFTVPGTPTSGTLDVASDNSYSVELNGNSVPVVFDQNNFQLATQDSYDVSAFLVSGLNTLEITVTNWESAEQSANPASNPAGLLYKLTLNENACVPPPPPQCDKGEYLNEDNQCVPEPEEDTATISALKIVCPAENLLPNWGYGASNITADTAADFLEENPSCYLANWTFEWAPNGTSNPGDNIEDADGVWTEFDSTVVVPAGARVWVREQFKSGYVPFSGDITEPRDQDVSAELYCSNDVLNYDNYDFINPVEAGETYYCVGFNAPEETEIVDVCPYVSGVQTQGPCESDQCESPDIWDSEEQECVPPETPEPPSNPECSDGVNNDEEDDLVDYPNDPGCDNPSDDNETDDFNPTSHSGSFAPGGSVAGAFTGQVLGESCGLYMDKFIRYGSSRNDVEQVEKLQAFLNKWMDANLPITGVYGPETLAALRAFQEKYANEVLTPWNLNGPTGIVYQTTLRWINMLECPDLALQIPELIEWSRNPNTPKEPLAVVPETVPAIQNSNQNEPEEDNTDDEFSLDDLTASAGNADDGNEGGGFFDFLKNLFGR